ncbi:hypothetical protein EDC94DRAFT_598015 [Helicostylum pulchrum]|nr:hypothetical protein EDC94DRAFT_598015 [Helicostylum pulchrum]
MKYLVLLMAIAMICLGVVTAALPEHPECARICQSANRGCTNNCTSNGGDDTICGDLCSDRYSGCIYKCLYNRNFNCTKK